jgi:phosphomevalonate kinase
MLIGAGPELLALLQLIMEMPDAGTSGPLTSIVVLSCHGALCAVCRRRIGALAGFDIASAAYRSIVLRSLDAYCN